MTLAAPSRAFFVLRAMFAGWGTNCFPFRIPARFARVVAPTSAGVSRSNAASGR
jgi:hypothetical protein